MRRSKRWPPPQQECLSWITVGEDSALGEVEIFGRHFQEHRRGAEDLTPKLLGGRLHRRPTADDAPACPVPKALTAPLCVSPSLTRT